jgi:hypothetical protein
VTPFLPSNPTAAKNDKSKYRSNFRGHRLRNFLALLAALMVCHATYAAELFGVIDAISGSAFVSGQMGKSSSISMGQKIYEGQTINTASDGEVHIVTVDRGIIALRPDTVFRVDEYKAEGGSADKIFMSLFKGAVRSITGWIGKHNTSSYRITTPGATIGIRGTDHETTVIDKADGDEPGTYDTVNEGATSLKTPQGETQVTPGKFAFASKGRAVAPVLLAKQPNFWAKRRLKIENRIQQRKEFFRSRMEEMRNNRIKRINSIHGTRGGQADKRGQAIKNRNGLREGRLEQTKQRQETRRKKVQRRQDKNKKITPGTAKRSDEKSQ